MKDVGDELRSVRIQHVGKCRGFQFLVWGFLGFRD